MAQRLTSSPGTSLRAFTRTAAHSIRRVDRWFRNFKQKRVNRVLSVVLFACMSVLLLTNETCTDIYGNYSPILTHLFYIVVELDDPLYQAQLRLKPSEFVKPALTGTDGSQSGVADFAGNFTTISLPPPGLFLIARLKDCSLDLLTATSATDSGTITTHFERTLHQLASLQTTPDAFPHGCASNLEGISTRTGVWSGFTPGGVPVFAGVTQNGLYYLSNATGNPTAITSMPYASGVISADLNGDGINDLVAVNGNGATSAFVSVLLGKSDGSFQANVDLPVGGDFSVSAVIDDVNGDGKKDIVAVSQDQQISILLGKGDGTFQSAISFAAPVLPGHTSASETPMISLITTDANGDGKKDIIGSNGLVLLGNGDGTFTAASSPAFPYTLATSNEGPNLAAGDLNNDGKVDVVLGTGNTISTWIGKGDGTFQKGNAYASIDDTGDVAISDLDGDGNSDIYVGLANGGIFSGDDSNPSLSYVLMGHGDGTFSGAPIAPNAYSGDNLVDINGDGIPDLVSNISGSFGNTVSSSFTVALGTGTGAFAAKSTVTAPDTISQAGYNFTDVSKANAVTYSLGDVNGDGKPDLVFVDNNLNAKNPGGLLIQYPYPIYFVALGNGDGTFQTPAPYTFPQIAPASGFDNQLAVTSLQIADFNKDGHADLVFFYNDQAGGTGVNPYLQGFVVLAGTGNGTFSTTATLTSTYSSSVSPVAAATDRITNIADLNGDGIPDLVVIAGDFTIATGTTSQIQIFLGKGDGTFLSPSTVAVAGNVYGIPVLVDLNGDGRNDLAFLTEDSSSQAGFAVALGNGNGAFASATISKLTGGDAIRSAGVARADFDGDGKIDLALIVNSGFSGIFYGQGDGTFTSVPESGYIVPKDLINLAGGAPAVAVDLNNDGKPDVLAGNVVFLSEAAPTASNPSATTTTVTASPTTAAAGTSVTFTATVAPSSGSGTPTGTVTFYDGSTALGNGTLSSGSAAYSTTSLAVGAHSVTAQYSGDANFNTSTSSTVTVSITAPIPDFSVSVSPASGTESGSTPATATVTVTPSNGFTNTVSFACSGLPSGLSCSFSPSTVKPAGAAVTTALSISGTLSAQSISDPVHPAVPLTLCGFGLGLLVLARAAKYGRFFTSISMLVFAFALTALGGCGSSNKKNHTQSATVTINATGGTTSQSTTYALTVNQ